MIHTLRLCNSRKKKVIFLVSVSQLIIPEEISYLSTAASKKGTQHFGLHIQQNILVCLRCTKNKFC